MTAKTDNTVVILSLLRRSDGLFALIANDPANAALPQLRCIPLADLPTNLYPQRQAMMADWQSLGTARALEQVWPAFWRIFWGTLTDTRAQASPAMPQRVASPSRPPATAAHPRAFRGTKFKPPKQPAPEFNLCVWLGDDRLLDGFFAHHDFTRLPVLGADGHPLPRLFEPDQSPTVSGLLAHGAGVPPDQWPALPESFRRAFMWQLRTRPFRDVLAWLQVWRGLGAEDQGAALVLPARLCALNVEAHAWGEPALTLSPSRQIMFLKAVLAQTAYLLPHNALSAQQLMELDTLSQDDDRFDLYLNAILSNLKRQVSVAYSLCGCSLANRVTEPHRKETLRSTLITDRDCAVVPMADIDRMSKALGDDRRFWELTVWENCGKLPGFQDVLRETCWERLSSDVADQWLAIFTHILWDEPNELKIPRRWRAQLATFPEWHRGLMALSGQWQEKYVRMLRSYSSGWDDADSLRKSVPILLPLQERLCRPPFSATVDGDCVLSSMAMHLPVEGWRQLAACGDSTWMMIERACRRDNDALLIRRGIGSLAQCWTAFTLQALFTAPRGLMRAARLLGCISYERRRQFLSQTSHSVWFATNWTDLEPYEACRTLYRLCVEFGVNSPVPRRLRDHFEGKAALTDMQIERHCRVSYLRLPAVLLAALERLIWSDIDAPFNLRAQSTAASHAVRLLAGLDGNRKALRRFLSAYRDGRGDAYLDHPLNRAWFARHPRLDPALWRQPPRFQKAESLGEVHLAVETDPLEILMLGTYVGSCLGLGGYCDYSAVACLLDANKQVVYARDESGRVLARQLVAIDERDRLVCFAVYPVNANESLLRAFQAFDLALAEALGIELYRDQEHDKYDIAIVLAQSWWDDGV